MIFLLCFIAFIVLSTLVIFRRTDTFEMPIVHAAVRLRMPLLTTLIAPVTFITSGLPTALLCLGASLYRLSFFRPRTWRGRIGAAWPAIAFVIAATLNIALRIAIGRLRPGVTVIDHNFLEIQTGYQRYSFPSGHATSGIIGFGTLVAMAWPSRRWRGRALVLAIMVVLSTGFGRVYLGVHWPTDVLGGYLLGVICSGVAYTQTRYALEYRHNVRSDSIN